MYILTTVFIFFCVCACVLMPQVISAVLGVYQSLLSLKNIPTLEAAYKMVLGEMACALSSLTVTPTPSGRAPAPGGPCPSIQHPAFASLNLPLEKAQFTIIFNLSTLTTIGNTKNSLIGVSGTKPFRSPIVVPQSNRHPYIQVHFHQGSPNFFSPH